MPSHLHLLVFNKFPFRICLLRFWENGSKMAIAKLHHFCFVRDIFLQILLFRDRSVDKTNNFSYDDAKFLGKNLGKKEVKNDRSCRYLNGTGCLHCLSSRGGHE